MINTSRKYADLQLDQELTTATLPNAHPSPNHQIFTHIVLLYVATLLLTPKTLGVLSIEGIATTCSILWNHYAPFMDQELPNEREKMIRPVSWKPIKTSENENW